MTEVAETAPERRRKRRRPAFVAVINGERVCVFRAKNADRALRMLEDSEGPLLENLGRAFHVGGRWFVWDGDEWPALRYAREDEYQLWRGSLKFALKHGPFAGKYAPLPDPRIDPTDRYSWFCYLIPIARTPEDRELPANVLLMPRR